MKFWRRQKPAPAPFGLEKQPLGSQYYILGVAMSGAVDTYPEYRELKQRQDEVFQTMARRNEIAQQLERQGEMDAAIKLYELNVADLFHGSLPYDRLRVLYTKLNWFQEAIRVCEAYLGLPDAWGNLDKDKFRHHRDRLEEKLKRQSQNR